MNQPKIAIIIPAYNAADYIERCIKSIQEQTYKNWTAYVVDDGSTDKTAQILDELKSSESRLAVKHTENRGVFSARRTAIDMVDGCEYLTFLDSDDYFCDRELFGKCIQKMEQDKIDCLGFNYVHNNGKEGFKCHEEKIWDNREDVVKNLLARVCIDGNMQYSFYRTEIVKANFEVQSYNNDDYINKYHILMNSPRVAYVPGGGYCYAYNPQSQTHSNIKERDWLYYEHVSKFTDEVMREYPRLQEECEYFRYWVLLWIMTQLSKDKKNKEMKLYSLAKSAFANTGKVYLFNHYFSCKGKITYLLLKIGLYEIMYNLYHWKARSD